MYGTYQRMWNCTRLMWSHTRQEIEDCWQMLMLKSERDDVNNKDSFSTR